MKVSTVAVGLAALSSVFAAPVESPVLARARGVYKRHLELGTIKAPLEKRQQGSSSNITDADILNFALQLEYLEAQYYHIAVYGTQLSQSLLTGTGTQGYIEGPGQQVPFTSTLVQQYGQQIAMDEMNHVADLRAALGSSAVAMPNINLNQSFTTAANAAGITNGTFNPFTSDAYFLLGAFLFEDVGVTAYNGAAPLIQSKTYLAAAASILAVEAYHASAIRANLIALAQNTSAIGTAANAAAAAESSLGGPGNNGIIVNGTANVVNNNASDGLAYARTPGQVLNIVYLGNSTTMGGFFPNGLNGNIQMATSSSSSS